MNNTLDKAIESANTVINAIITRNDEAIATMPTKTRADKAELKRAVETDRKESLIALIKIDTGLTDQINAILTAELAAYGIKNVSDVEYTNDKAQKCLKAIKYWFYVPSSVEGKNTLVTPKEGTQERKWYDRAVKRFKALDWKKAEKEPAANEEVLLLTLAETFADLLSGDAEAGHAFDDKAIRKAVSEALNRAHEMVDVPEESEPTEE